MCVNERKLALMQQACALFVCVCVCVCVCVFVCVCMEPVEYILSLVESATHPHSTCKVTPILCSIINSCENFSVCVYVYVCACMYVVADSLSRCCICTVLIVLPVRSSVQVKGPGENLRKLTLLSVVHFMPSVGQI